MYNFLTCVDYCLQIYDVEPIGCRLFDVIWEIFTLRLCLCENLHSFMILVFRKCVTYWSRGFLVSLCVYFIISTVILSMLILLTINLLYYSVASCCLQANVVGPLLIHSPKIYKAI